jgi:uncharacterized protein Yka (UPF0111/DUF47 family)
MLGSLRVLMPREDRFFSLFEQYATLVVATAESLRAALAGGPALHQQLQAVVDRANEADAITRKVILAVRRAVITPFGAIATGFGIARRLATSEKVARVTPKQS